MVAASLSASSMEGCFVEVGKRDIWSPQRVAQERPDLAYRLVAIDFWTPKIVSENMTRLASMLHTGEEIQSFSKSRRAICTFHASGLRPHGTAQFPYL